MVDSNACARECDLYGNVWGRGSLDIPNPLQQSLPHQPGMNWHEVGTLTAALLERFDDENARLPVGRASTAQKAFENVIKAETTSAAKIDLIVRKLLTGKPVANSPADCYFLSQRLKFGLVIARALSTPGPQDRTIHVLPKKARRELVMSWLLIDVWRSTNRHLWRSILKGMLGAMCAKKEHPKTGKHSAHTTM